MPEDQRKVKYYDSDGNTIATSQLDKYSKVYDSDGNTIPDDERTGDMKESRRKRRM